jgi:CRISPR/Cas system-associated endonuclease Cas1
MTRPTTEQRQPDPMKVNIDMTGMTTAAVIPAEKPGVIVQFVDKGDKIVAVIDGQEIDVPAPAGKPKAKLGEDGTLQIATSRSVTLDVTAELNARLKAEREIDRLNFERQKKAEIDAINRAAKKDKFLTGAGAFAAGYAAGRLSR